jgi:hypothetical protein
MNTLAETYKHKRRVAELMSIAIKHLITASVIHDDSKTQTPEAEVFEEYTPKLAGVTYGSDKYKEYLKEMKVALDHHYAVNEHHPEHFTQNPNGGIKGMNLLHIIEMLCDWKAATERHNDGDIKKSIEHNQKRFGYSDDLKQIFLNTVFDLDW